MSKNEDEKLVTKGAMKKAIHNLGKAEPERYVKAHVYNSALGDCISAIDKLPTVSIKSPEQIERAIEYFENISDNDLITYFGSRYSTKYIAKMFADFVRCILNQPSTWNEEKIFGKSDGKNKK